MVADKLSWVIFNNPNYSLDWLVSKLAKEIFVYQDDDRLFRKSGKRGYRYILMQLIVENRAIQIKKYEKIAISAFPVG